MQPLTHDIGISVSQFTLALAVQDLAWEFLQPVAGALSMAWRIGVALGLAGGKVAFALIRPSQPPLLKTA